MKHIKSINEFSPLNISLSENEYETLLKGDVVEVSISKPGSDTFRISLKPNSNATIILSRKEFIDLSNGRIVDKGNINLALQDIGLDRIKMLRKKYKV